MEHSRKPWRPLLLFLTLLLLAACGPAAEPDPAPAPTGVADAPDEEAPPQPAADPTATMPPTAAAPVAAEEEAAAEEVAPAGDDDAPAAYVPAASLTEAATVRADDWIKGALDDPLIVIVEYGDFQ